MDNKLNIYLAKLQLRTMCLTRDTMQLIVDCAIIRHTMSTGALVVHNLNNFHLLINRSNLHGIRHPDFTIHKRKNLSYDKLASIPMHVLPLGVHTFITS